MKLYVNSLHMGKIWFCYKISGLNRIYISIFISGNKDFVLFKIDWIKSNVRFFVLVLFDIILVMSFAGKVRRVLNFRF
jgi:hypothetical protein